MSEARVGEAANSGRWRGAYRSRRYAILFYTLLATLAAGPLVEAVGWNAQVLEILLAATLLAAVAPLAGGKPGRLLLGLLVVAGAARFGAARLGYSSLSTASLALWSLVALLAVAGVLQFSLRARTIDSEHLYAALDAYLLVGVFMGVLYWVVEHLAPGSIRGAAVENDGELTVPTMIYFSFVTLATLGYGDIVPHSEAARGIAVVEAVAGQLYLAVMIARMVSLYGRGAERIAGQPAAATLVGKGASSKIYGTGD